MTKVHLLLIFLTLTMFGIGGWLLLEDNKVSTDKKEDSSGAADSVFQDKRTNQSEQVKNKTDYIQGPAVLPDLEQGFKRCLGRGYNEWQMSMLESARNAFAEKSFDEGSYAWNEVTYTDQYGDLIKLVHKSDKTLETLKEVDGNFESQEVENDIDLEMLKERLEGEQVSLNLFAQSFKVLDIEMFLILKNGLMKSLEIKNKTKKVVCKP